MKIKTLLLTSAVAFSAVCSSHATVLLTETFDDSTQFTTNSGFFSDGTGDYFGLAGGTADFGAGAEPSALKSYTGFTGSFLTGMDLDGDQPTIPITVTWSSIDIIGFTEGFVFSGDFAEFFDTPGDIDALDSLFVEAQIDGGGFFTILEFIPGSFTSTTGDFNGFFENGTATLGDAAQTFTAPIVGSGSTLDLRLTVSVDSGDEDFAVDNFVITAVPEPSTALLGALGALALLRRRR